MKRNELFDKHLDHKELNRLLNVLVNQLNLPKPEEAKIEKPDLTVFDKEQISKKVEDSVNAFLADRSIPADRDVAIVEVLLRYFFDHFFDDEESFRISGNELFYIFMTSAAFGSLVEALWCRFSNGFWERRTSVIYGDLSFAEAIGGVFLTLVLKNDLKAPLEDIFAKSFFWGTILEYVMSWGEETFTGYRSWDYSSRFLNINGRVCFLYSCFWGVLGVAWTKLVYPVMKQFYEKVPNAAKKPLFWVLLPLLLGDISISIIAKNRFSDRRDGIPAQNAFDKWVDEHYPDETVINAYPNSVKVDKDGNLEADTLNNTNSHALESGTWKSKLKAQENSETGIREELKEKSSDVLTNLTADIQVATQGKVAELHEVAADKAADLREKAHEKVSETLEDAAQTIHRTAKEQAKQVMGIITQMALPGFKIQRPKHLRNR